MLDAKSVNTCERRGLARSIVTSCARFSVCQETASNLGNFDNRVLGFCKLEVLLRSYLMVVGRFSAGRKLGKRASLKVWCDEFPGREDKRNTSVLEPFTGIVSGQVGRSFYYLMAPCL